MIHLFWLKEIHHNLLNPTGPSECFTHVVIFSFFWSKSFIIQKHICNHCHSSLPGCWMVKLFIVYNSCSVVSVEGRLAGFCFHDIIFQIRGPIMISGYSSLHLGNYFKEPQSDPWRDILPVEVPWILGPLCANWGGVYSGGRHILGNRSKGLRCTALCLSFLRGICMAVGVTEFCTL